jgi:aldose 1-epimerase
VLASPDSGLATVIGTDQPGLQVYPGNFLDGSVPGTGGSRYRQGAGIALEPQAFPDSPNHPEYPSTVLRPGEEYRSRIVWRFVAWPDPRGQMGHGQPSLTG